MGAPLQKPTPYWSVEGAFLRIHTDALPEALRQRTLRHIEDWRGREWLEGPVLVLDSDQWRELGVPPLRGAGPEEEEHWLDAWAALHLLLMDLLGIQQQSVHLDIVGFIGAAAARLHVTVDGKSTSPATQDALGFSRVEGALHPTCPLTAWLLREAATFAGQDRKGQLATWARMRHVLDLAEPRLQGRFTCALGEHLASIKPQVAQRFSLAWEPSGPQGRFMTLKTRMVLPDASERELPYADFDPRGIVCSDAKQPILLPEPVARVVEIARRRDRKLLKDVKEELADPAQLIPEGVEVDAYFDLSHYSERVAGFEWVKSREAPAGRESSGLAWFAEAPEEPGAFLELVLEQAKDIPQRIPVATREEALRLFEENERALSSGAVAPLQVGSWQLPPSEALRLQLQTALALTPQAPPGGPDPQSPDVAPQGRGVLAAIVRELGASEQHDSDGLVIGDSQVPWQRLEAVLSPGIHLKPHQRRGIAWLWHHASANTPGIVLAGDMGLGKTLQVACFLALRHAMQGHSPQLVVCPTVLIDNWLEELERFFRRDAWGTLYALHDKGLKRLTRGDSLDLDTLARQQLIVTNYETLARYQRSLLRLSFDVVVFDEAHNVKNPDTLRSRAARALKRNFSVAMSGTPVENELGDVWAIYDAAQIRQPRSLGTRAEFSRDYASRGPEGIEALRQRLLFPSPASTLLRREKREALRDLPPKHMEVRRVEMTQVQVEHEQKIARLASTGSIFRALEALQKLYQHPALLTDSHASLSPEPALEVSPKTRLCFEILEDIRRAGPDGLGEKALVFVISRRMQELLVQLIEHRFGLRQVHIINGDPDNRSSALRRIKDFSEQPGFNVLVLSPLAAGVGLNIVAANHVIHYGRWWNPAKEDQATDRAYRIGQQRPVRVYYPVLHRPGRPEEGFDVQLHTLVERKRAIARDFLAPEEPLEAQGAELSSLFGQKSWT
jgi:hypothetical protein